MLEIGRIQNKRRKKEITLDVQGKEVQVLQYKNKHPSLAELSAQDMEIG